MKDLRDLDLSTKKYLIFDMDGTLIDSIGIWNITDYKLIKRFSGKEIPLDIIQKERDLFLEKNFDKDIYLAYCNYLLNKYNFSLSKEELITIRWKVAEELLENGLDFKPSADILLKRLKELDYTLVLATATTRRQLDIYSKKNKKMKEKLDIYEIFDYIISKENVTYKKPHPEIYLSVIKHYQAQAQECLVFEDSLHGVMASKSAGIEVVNVYDTYSDCNKEVLNQLSDYQINTYSEFIETTLSNYEKTYKKINSSYNV